MSGKHILRATQIDLVLSEEGMRKLNATIEESFEFNSDQVLDDDGIRPYKGPSNKHKHCNQTSLCFRLRDKKNIVISAKLGLELRIKYAQHSLV